MAVYATHSGHRPAAAAVDRPAVIPDAPAGVVHRSGTDLQAIRAALVEHLGDPGLGWTERDDIDWMLRHVDLMLQARDITRRVARLENGIRRVARHLGQLAGQVKTGGGAS